MNPFLAIGLIVNSALYLGGVFVAALVGHNLFAEYLALVAMGATYLSYAIQLQWPHAIRLGAFAVVLSIMLGAIAGLALL